MMGSRFKINPRGTSLVVQRLRIYLPMQEMWVPCPVRELRSHVPCGEGKKKETKMINVIYISTQ